jgi:putative SOS response-associated peptidase YedK
MPVLLERRDYELWLDPGVREAQIVVPLLVPSAPDLLEDIVVGDHVNNPRNDDPSCIAPA